ncbi:MAG: glycosyltransferase family 2 protein, partial [Deltaproteobacteria bacterium]|nr:glycosyltransferase family 2 protein [Deltaproteobacteria bacterium]
MVGHSISVVIMAYNEEGNISLQVGRTLKFFGENARDFEIICVDDGSTDGTGSVCEEFAAKDSRIRVIHHARNLGMGAAIKTGYSAATKEYVTQLPGDAQVNPEMFKRFLPLLGENDLILSRYEKRDDGILRSLLTTGFKITGRLITGFPCDFTGTMFFRREFLDRMKMTSDSFFINFEVAFGIMKLTKRAAYVNK